MEQCINLTCFNVTAGSLQIGNENIQSNGKVTSAFATREDIDNLSIKCTDVEAAQEVHEDEQHYLATKVIRLEKLHKAKFDEQDLKIQRLTQELQNLKGEKDSEISKEYCVSLVGNTDDVLEHTTPKSIISVDYQTESDSEDIHIVLRKWHRKSNKELMVFIYNKMTIAEIVEVMSVYLGYAVDICCLMRKYGGPCYRQFIDLRKTAQFYNLRDSDVVYYKDKHHRKSSKTSKTTNRV